MNFSITQNGKKLSKRKYNWNKDTKILSTNENNLVLDFSEYNGVTFKTGHNCTFKTGNGCIFKTNSNCTFNTGDYCTFKTGYNCTFNIGSSCTFTCREKCVCIRRDIYEVIEIPENKTIILNKYEIKGYSFQIQKRKIVINGKEIEMSEESYQNLKESLI